MHILRYVHHHPFSSAAFILVTVVAVAIFSLFLFFPQNINQFISQKISGSLGRNFSIDGALDIDWDWTTPSIHAEKIRISNLPGRPDPYLMDIETLDMEIKVWNLLRGRTVIPKLSIENPKIVLEKIDAKTKNWNFPTLSKSKVLADAALPNDRHDFPIVDILNVKNGQVIYRDPEADLNLDLKLDTISGTSADDRDIIKIEGKGTMQGQEFSLIAQGAGIKTLRDTRKNFPLHLELQMGATKISIDGTFKDPIKMTGIDATLELSGNTMSDLFYLTALPLPPTPPYKLAGQLGKRGDVWSYNKFKGQVGDSDLSGDASYDIGGERGFLKGNLYSQNMDVDDLGGFIGLAPSTGAGETAAPEQKKQAAREKASPRLLPDVPLKLERLRSADMDVTLKVDKLVAPSLPFNGMNIHFDLKDGLLKLDPMNLSMADGSVDGSLILDGRQKTPDVAMNVDFKKLKLNRFFDGTRFEENTQANIGAHVELKGKGLSFAEVMGASDGRIVSIVSGGTISLLLVEASNLDLAEAMPLFLGEDQTTRIRCGVGDFKVNNGQLRSEIFVLDTDDSTVEGHVNVNLKNESIDGQLQTSPKDVSPLSLQSPIVISGPLKNPNIGLEPGETGARAGVAAVLGAILTPLAAIIPYIELGEGEDQNCGALVARAKADAKKG